MLYRAKAVERRPTKWTRLTGLSALAALYAALVAGVLPLPPHPDTRTLRLALTGCAVVGVLAWTAASARAPRADAVVLRKGEPRERRRSRTLCGLVGFVFAFAGGAALMQGVGPDGAYGRWVSEVYAAGGGTYRIPVDKVLGAPRQTGVLVNDVDEYVADVRVTVPFADGARHVDVRGATTVGRPSEGDSVTVLFAPGRPSLGVRHRESGFVSGGFIILWIWALTLCGGIGAGLLLDWMETEGRWWRAFRGDVHGVVAALLCVGVGLLLPGALHATSTLTSWLLALAASLTPALALAWVVRRT